MQKGADLARISADIALLEDDIARVADAKTFADAALRRVHENHNLSLGLNSAILAAAALGVLSPVWSAVLHNGTTLAILANALRVRQLADG